MIDDRIHLSGVELRAWLARLLLEIFVLAIAFFPLAIVGWLLIIDAAEYEAMKRRGEAAAIRDTLRAIEARQGTTRSRIEDCSVRDDASASCALIDTRTGERRRIEIAGARP